MPLRGGPGIPNSPYLFNACRYPVIHRVMIIARWQCTVCGYVYDEEKGEPATHTPPNTIFDDLPSDWRCPVCQAEKSAFRRLPEKDEHEGALSTVSDVLVAELATWGIQYIFGIPGTSSLGLVDALRRQDAIRYIQVRHEENAAMAASAFFKLTGTMAACLTIAGPGATNLSTGLYDAKEDHASLLSLNGQVEIQYKGQGGFQEIDQDSFFRPITVFNNTIYDRRVAVLLLTRALKYAILHRGVAQLSVPNDIQKQSLEASFCQKETCIPPTTILPQSSSIQAAADRINGSDHPVILAGWGAFPYGEAILTLARTIGAPILTTYRAKGVLPEANEWVIGILGNVGPPQARSLVSSTDCLITLGVGFSRFTNVPTDRPMVQVDLDPIKLGKGPKSLSLWGDCGLVLGELLPRCTERDTVEIHGTIQKMKDAWDSQRAKEADPDAIPLRPPYIMSVLSDEIPEDAVLSLDVGENHWWFGRNFRIKRQRFVMSGYLATMGFGFPGAIAAKLAYPEKEVFCITGDGGFAMAMPDFVTAIKYDLSIVVLLLNNHQLGMIQVEQMMEGYQNFATDLQNPDFVAFAEACGGTGIRVQRPADLAPAVREARKERIAVIVDIETDAKRF